MTCLKATVVPVMQSGAPMCDATHAPSLRWPALRAAWDPWEGLASPAGSPEGRFANRPYFFPGEPPPGPPGTGPDQLRLNLPCCTQHGPPGPAAPDARIE